MESDGGRRHCRLRFVATIRSAEVMSSPHRLLLIATVLLGGGGATDRANLWLLPLAGGGPMLDAARYLPVPAAVPILAIGRHPLP